MNGGDQVVIKNDISLAISTYLETENLELYDCDTSSEGYSFCSSFQTEGDCDQIDECSWTNNNSSSGNYCKSPSKLSDWNGSTNGGDYHVIWLEMSASW